MKSCSLCKQEQDFSQFRRDSRYRDGYGSWCRSCANAKSRNRKARQRYEDPVYREKNRRAGIEWRKKFPEKSRASQRRAQYGIEAETFSYLVDRQGGQCAICGVTAEESGRRDLCLDHCHETGAFRGILCTRCNAGIGMLADDPHLVRIASEYLEESVSPRQCAGCQRVIRSPYEMYEERLEFRRVEGKKRDATILLRILCEACKQLTVASHRPVVDSHVQGSFL